MIGTTIAAFFFETQFSNAMIVSSLFFAFANFYPEEVIYIMFYPAGEGEMAHLDFGGVVALRGT